MKELEFTPQIQLFLKHEEPLVLQVYAILGDSMKIAPVFLTKDEITHLSVLYSNQLSKIIETAELPIIAHTGSIAHLYFKHTDFLLEKTPIQNGDLPLVKYLLIELKKDQQYVQLLKKVTHKQRIEGRQQQIIPSKATPIKQRNVLDLTPKIQAISMNNQTFIA